MSLVKQLLKLSFMNISEKTIFFFRVKLLIKLESFQYYKFQPVLLLFHIYRYRKEGRLS